MNKTILTVITGLGLQALIAGNVLSAEADDVKLNDNTKRMSYSLGYQIGGDFRRQGVEMDAAAVLRGIEDALADADPQIPRKAMSEILMELKRSIVQRERDKLVAKTNKGTNRRQTELQYLAEGRDFLAQNQSRPGIEKTDSGLQFHIVESGRGDRPGPKDTVTVHYRGTLIDGSEFDSSYDSEQPARFRLDSVIPGWREGLQLIGAGGKIRLFVPPVLAYRHTGPLAHRTLIFDVELIAVEPAG